MPVADRQFHIMDERRTELMQLPVSGSHNKTLLNGIWNTVKYCGFWWFCVNNH
jgi:hypothetical protein